VIKSERKTTEMQGDTDSNKYLHVQEIYLNLSAFLLLKSILIIYEYFARLVIMITNSK